MRSKVYFIGLGGGLLVTAALYYPLYVYLPGTAVAGWPTAQATLAQVLTGVAALLLVATGAVAARNSGTTTRGEAAGAGAVAGLIAAAVAEMWLGGAAGGVWGVRQLLAHGLRPTSDEAAFLSLVSDAVVSAQWWTYVSIWIAMLAGPALGAAGGALAGPGGIVVKPPSGTWPTELSVIGVISSVMMMIVSSAIFARLGPSVQSSADQAGHILIYPASSVIAWPTATNLILLAVWQALGWWWLKNANPPTAAGQNRLQAIAWVNGFLPIAMIALLVVGTRDVALTPIALTGLLVSLALSALTLRFGWELRSIPKPPTPSQFHGVRFFTSEVAMSAGILLGAIYIGVASPLNFSLLIVPMISTLALHDASAPLTTLPLIVDANYVIHRSILLYGGALFVLANLLVAAGVWAVGRMRGTK